MELEDKEFHKKIEQKSSPHQETLQAIFRDSTIQRFEYTIDTLWKYCKYYLEEQLLAPENPSPRSIIRACTTLKYISEQESESILNMLNDRNETSHVYNQDVACEIMSRIGGYTKTLRVIVTRLEPPKQ